MKKIETFFRNLLNSDGVVSSQRFQMLWQMILLTALIVLWFIIALQSHKWGLDIEILDKLNYALAIITGGTTLKLFQTVFAEKKKKTTEEENINEETEIEKTNIKKGE